MARQSDYYFYIGSVEIAKKIEEFTWSYNDVDAPKSGRTLDAVMHRGRVTDKKKLQVKLRPITREEAVPIISSLRTQYITVRTNMLPESGTSFTAYNSGRSGGIAIVSTDGVVRYKDISFNIIER